MKPLRVRTNSSLRILIALCVLVLISADSIYSQTDTKDVQKGSGRSPSGPAAVQTDKAKVVFDVNAPGVVIVEANGERIRIDTNLRTVETLTGGQPTSVDHSDKTDTAAVPKPADADEPLGAYDFDKGEEPFDYRVVNIPTPKSVPKGTWNLTFTHRFTQPVHPISDSASGLFGLDSFGVASFGVTYGVTDKLYLSAYRSPICQKGICRVIEAGVGYNWITQDVDTPLAFSTYASIEGNDNFSEEFTFNLQAMLSSRIGKRVYLFFSPAVHLNSNGQRRFNPRSTDFFPRAPIADAYILPKHTASFGIGTAVMITPNVLALFDFTPRIGFKQGQIRPVFNSSFNLVDFVQDSYPSIGFGVQRNIGRHSFTLTFSNTQGTTTSRYNSSTLAVPPKHLIIGFNLARRF